MKIVKITWIDAQSINTKWTPIEEAKDYDTVETDIVGFLIDETKERIILSEECGEGLVKYIHIIPKRSILKIKELKEKR